MECEIEPLIIRWRLCSTGDDSCQSNGYPIANGGFPPRARLVETRKGEEVSIWSVQRQSKGLSNKEIE